MSRQKGSVEIIFLLSELPPWVRGWIEFHIRNLISFLIIEERFSSQVVLILQTY